MLIRAFLTSQIPNLTELTTERNASTAFPIPAGVVAEGPRAITAEEKEGSAYRTLRDARAKHRNEGARLARVKKAEEEAAAAKK